MGFLQKHGLEVAACAATLLAVIALFALVPFPHAARSAAATDHALGEQTRYSLDAATIGGTTTVLHWHPQPRLALARGEPIGFTGWAVDAGAHAPVSAVVAVVDGGPTFPGVIGIRRDDVAAALGASSLAHAGFTLTIPGCALAAGTHRVAFRFEAADGRGYYRSNDDVDIDVGSFARARRVSYAVDSIAPPLSAPGPHRIDGWLVDASACTPARAVRILVDGRVVATATYGTPRPDVAAALGAPAYEGSGFSARWTDPALSAGLHTLRLEAELSAGSDVDAGYALRFGR